MIPLASFASRTLGKRMRKAATQAQEKSGFFTTYLVELFKNHKLAKIFQKEKFEINRADFHLNGLMEKNKKIVTLLVRMRNDMQGAATMNVSTRSKMKGCSWKIIR